MPPDPTNCSACGEPLEVVQTEGRPDLTSSTCTSSTCALRGLDQSARGLRPGSVQVLLGSHAVTRLEHRRPSQGEDNCAAVAEELRRHLGTEFAIYQDCPPLGAARDSRKEQGFDFSIQEPCRCITEVQVTRVPEERHLADLARAAQAGTYLVDERSHSSLVAAIEAALRNKTAATPPKDRARRILAIDGLCPSLGFCFFMTGIRFTNTRDVFGWRGVVVVADHGNAIWLGSESWPPCTKHGSGSTDHGV